MASDFVVGQTYNRRRDIHARFSGQRQSGIVTPAKYPAVFIFTGRGEGQKGDMTLTKGNKAIANHSVDGKDLLLFEMLGGGQVRFRGPFNCAGYSFEDGKDQRGNVRKAIVFHLVPVADESTELEPPPLACGGYQPERTAQEGDGCRRPSP